MLLCKCRSQKTEREIEALPAVFLPKLLCKVAWLTLHLWLPSKKVTEEGRKEGADSQLPLETAAAQNTTETAKKKHKAPLRQAIGMTRIPAPTLFSTH